MSTERTPPTAYESFVAWLQEETPNLYAHFTSGGRSLLNERQFHHFKWYYTSVQMTRVLYKLENRPDKLKNYRSLRLTLGNWLEREYGEPKLRHKAQLLQEERERLERWHSMNPPLTPDEDED